MNTPIAYGISKEADFEARTWTFDLEPGFKVSAGRFAIVPAARPVLANEDQRAATDAAVRASWLKQFSQTSASPVGLSPLASHPATPAGAWTRCAETPPPLGIKVALYTPEYGIEEFVNDGPEVYPDWSMAQSWWVALPGEPLNNGGAE